MFFQQWSTREEIEAIVKSKKWHSVYNVEVQHCYVVWNLYNILLLV